jgi:hypothetical protein
MQALAGAVVFASLSACSTMQAEYPDKQVGQDASNTIGGGRESFLGDGGLNIFGDSKKGSKDDGANHIGINAYLWRASLETLAFMPLASADPFGGVIITDWYAPPESPSERFKMSVFITDRDLHADGIRVSVFRQVKSGGEWADASLTGKTAGELENAILTRARELRAATAALKKS